MRAFTVVAALLLLLAGVLPAIADTGRKIGIIVNVHPPVAGTKVEILDPQGNTLAEGVTNAEGRFEIDVELPEGVDGVFVSSGSWARSDDLGVGTVRARHNVYNVHPGEKSDSAAMLVRIKRAVVKCDKAEYDHWVAELDRRIAELEQLVDQRQAAADEFARANNLRITDLKGARKDLDRAGKAQSQIKDASLRNPAMLETLQAYVGLLQEIEWAKQDLDAARKARQGVPPFPKDCKKKDEVGMAPGKCQDGSGGLLAGTINDIFGTDLAAACADRSQQRDTDRPRKDKDRHHEHRD
jgi:hypothetical protein